MTRRHLAPTDWLATALIATAVFLDLWALQLFIVDSPWIRTCGAILLITAVGVALTRSLSGSRVLPTLVGFIVAILLLVPSFVPHESGGRSWLPTPSALADLGAVLNDGIRYAQTTVPPAAVAPELAAVLTTAAVLLYLAVDHIAVAWRFAATSGILLLSPWLAPIILEHDIHAAPLIGAVAAWLVVLALVSRSHVGMPSLALGPALAATTAAVMIGLLAAPLAFTGPGWGALPALYETSRGGSSSTRLSVELDLRQSLDEQSTAPVMSYTSTGGRPSAFKVHSLADFDGVTWDESPSPSDAAPASSGEVLWSTTITNWDDLSVTEIAIDPVRLNEENFALPPEPRRLDTSAPFTYSRGQDSATLTAGTTLGQPYTVTIAQAYVTPEVLLASEAGVGTEFDATSPEYLNVPSTIDVERISTLAASITADAGTRYEQAIALQAYLRSPLEFVYDVNVEPATEDAVSTFLDTRVGYCVQFATTMITMARTLDIPSRLAVGYLPGESRGTGTYIVGGADAHAWPELWFPSVGWVRFEPTPSVQSGAPPRYSTDAALQSAVEADETDSSTPTPAPTTSPSETPVPSASPTSEASHEDDAAATALLPWTLLGVGMLLLMVLALVAVHLRKRSHQLEARTPHEEWEGLRSALPSPWAWSSAASPREAVAHVERVAGDRGVELDASTHTSLSQFATAVEKSDYAPEGSSATMAQCRHWRHTITTAVRRASKVKVAPETGLGTATRGPSRSGDER